GIFVSPPSRYAPAGGRDGENYRFGSLTRERENFGKQDWTTGICFFNKSRRHAHKRAGRVSPTGPRNARPDDRLRGTRLRSAVIPATIPRGAAERLLATRLVQVRRSAD